MCIPELFVRKEIYFKLVVLETPMNLKGLTVKQVCLVVCMCIGEGVRGQAASTSYSYLNLQKRIVYKYFLTKAAKAERTQRNPIRFSLAHRPTTLWALYNFRIRLKPFSFYFFGAPRCSTQPTISGNISNAFFFEAVEKASLFSSLLFLQGHDMVLLLPIQRKLMWK